MFATNFDGFMLIVEKILDEEDLHAISDTRALFKQRYQRTVQSSENGTTGNGTGTGTGTGTSLLIQFLAALNENLGIEKLKGLTANLNLFLPGQHSFERSDDGRIYYRVATATATARSANNHHTRGISLHLVASEDTTIDANENAATMESAAHNRLSGTELESESELKLHVRRPHWKKGAEGDTTRIRSFRNNNELKFSLHKACQQLEELQSVIKCSICLETLEDPYVVPDCGHRFCKECIHESIRLGNRQCPECRQIIRTKRHIRQDRQCNAMISKFHNLTQIMKGNPANKGIIGNTSTFSSGASSTNSATCVTNDNIPHFLEDDNSAQGYKTKNRSILSRPIDDNPVSYAEDQEGTAEEFKQAMNRSNISLASTTPSSTTCSANEPTSNFDTLTSDTFQSQAAQVQLDRSKSRTLILEKMVTNDTPHMGMELNCSMECEGNRKKAITEPSTKRMMHYDAIFTRHVDEMRQYIETHNTSYVAESISIPLAQWSRRMRQSYSLRGTNKKPPMRITGKRIEQLNAIHFDWAFQKEDRSLGFLTSGEYLSNLGMDPIRKNPNHKKDGGPQRALLDTADEKGTSSNLQQLKPYYGTNCPKQVTGRQIYQFCIKLRSLYREWQRGHDESKTQVAQSQSENRPNLGAESLPVDRNQLSSPNLCSNRKRCIWQECTRRKKQKKVGEKETCNSNIITNDFRRKLRSHQTDVREVSKRAKKADDNKMVSCQAEAAFDSNIKKMKHYVNRYRTSHVTTKNKSLYQWSYRLRQAFKLRGTGKKTHIVLNGIRIKKLDSIGFEWEHTGSGIKASCTSDGKSRLLGPQLTRFDNAYERNIKKLRKWKIKRGTMCLSRSTDKQLRSFCTNLRRLHRDRERNVKDGVLRITDKRIEELESLGFDWVFGKPFLKPNKVGQTETNIVVAECNKQLESEMIDTSRSQITRFVNVYNKNIIELRKWKTLPGPLYLNTNTDRNLSRFCSKLRGLYRDRQRGTIEGFLRMNDKRVEELESLGFDWESRKPYLKVNDEFKDRISLPVAEVVGLDTVTARI
uniref:RING-type domain-containing protein n=1 Tax=Chaetoceros debilis TaxID=122233 RepID=A0A7S3Q2F9_9STRA